MIRDLLVITLAVFGASVAVSFLIGNALLARLRRPRKRPGPGVTWGQDRRPVRDDFTLAA